MVVRSPPTLVPAASPPWIPLGSTVALLPIGAKGNVLKAEVTHWLVGGARVAVSIGVRTSAFVADACSGQRLWLSGLEALNGELIVLEAHARTSTTNPESRLILTEVSPVAHEYRRASVRAAVEHPVSLCFSGQPPTAARLNDLSHEGCSLVIDRSVPVPFVGSTVHVVITLPGADNLALSGDVVRAQQASGQIALRLHPIDTDVANIDRLVFTAIKESGGARLPSSL